MNLKYVNMDVNSEFLNPTNAMACIRIQNTVYSLATYWRSEQLLSTERSYLEKFGPNSETPEGVFWKYFT